MKIRSYLGVSLVLLMAPVILRQELRARSDLGLATALAERESLSPNGRRLLQEIVNSAELTDLGRPDFSRYQKDVAEFYESCGAMLPWVAQNKPTGQARIVIRALENAGSQGLRAEDYDGPLWEARLARLGRSPVTPEPDLVKFDLALTVSTMRYVTDVHIGRVNPHLFHFGLDFDHDPINLSEFLERSIAFSNHVEASLQAIEPIFPIYARTKEALRKYTDFARRDDGVPLPVPTGSVKPGDTYEGIPRLVRLLTLLGDLPQGQWKSSGTGRYQGALVDAVRRFQARHGLEPSGFLDAPTLNELNTPFAHRVTQIQLAMERMRWLPHEFDRPPIVVNIPEFRLYAVDGDYRRVFDMKVVVGNAYGHQTPVFADEIKSIIFRPYWNVPESITRAELLPHLIQNPLYFLQNAYEVVDGQEHVVSRGAVSTEMRSELLAGNLSVRQRPGPKNALGLVKFDFPNSYDVYLHGTSAAELFSKTRRDLSHGCIRVEDPVKLAKWLLRDVPGWEEAEIRSAMKGATTLQVKLEKPTPILIFYSTVVVLEDGIVRFYDDLYGYDASLEHALSTDLSSSRSE